MIGMVRATSALGREALLWCAVLALTTAACSAGEEGDGSPGTARGERAVPGSDTAAAAARGDVRPGIDVLLADSLHLVRGRRAGLITNQTGVGREGRSTIDLLHGSEATELVALFSPEHGIRGEERAGEAVESGRDPRTGLPVHSLYGDTRKPTPAMLEGVEILLFDIQDIGARYYTYVSTMGLAMEAAEASGIPFVVLDRPNPVGGHRVQGNVLDPAHASFVGRYPVAMRHGMTVGELARFIRARRTPELRLHVVPVRGWQRDRWFDGTGLPWVAPSPNMPDLASATHYPGTCLFEGTNLSVGRGTDRPFRQIGAPWLDGEELARRLNGREMSGVRFEAVRFTPEDPGDGKFGGREVRGVRFRATDRDAYDPTRAGLAALLEARRLAGDRWSWRARHFDRLAGTGRLRRAVEEGASMDSIVRSWEAQLRQFRAVRDSFLIYGSP